MTTETTFSDQGAFQFTAGAAGDYDIVAAGAQGGSEFQPGGYENAGGEGAIVGGDIYLVAGEKLEIIVGGAGVSVNGDGGGGGGGSFVLDVDDGVQTLATPVDLVIAGGGGGGGASGGGGGGRTIGTGGAGGGASSYGAGGVNGAAGHGGLAGGGGGFTGGWASFHSADGKTLGTSFSGGSRAYEGGPGGYGGGGGGGYGGGGGGGYGGGGGAGFTYIVAPTAGGGGYSATYGAGGGGGSFVASDATHVVKTAAANTGNGRVTITYEGVACYARGALILTPRGEVAVEDLRIGDFVVTAASAERPIKWIGQRAYSARFVRNYEDAHPVCFKAGAIADNIPKRDLYVSPRHAMLIDGLLIEAEALINGVSIDQPTPRAEVQYFHVELESHDALIANGAASESYFDDDNRDMFENADTYRALYPSEARRAAVYCAPRLESGHRVARIRRRLAERAGAPMPDDIALGALRGEIETLDAEGVRGWAQSEAFPDAPVTLEARLDGEVLGYAYAAIPRRLGGRRFALRFAKPLDNDRLARVNVVRALDDAALPRRQISDMV